MPTTIDLIIALQKRVASVAYLPDWLRKDIAAIVASAGATAPSEDLTRPSDDIRLLEVGTECVPTRGILISSVTGKATVPITFATRKNASVQMTVATGVPLPIRVTKVIACGGDVSGLW